MARLIDADALFHEMFFHATSVSVCGTVDEARGMTRMKKICMEDVKKAPTVDAVPVVRCKVCKHSIDYDFSEGQGFCDLTGLIVRENFYCAEGKKNE